MFIICNKSLFLAIYSNSIANIIQTKFKVKIVKASALSTCKEKVRKQIIKGVK